MDVGTGLACVEHLRDVPIEWVIDTGSGNHLAGRDELPPALRDAIAKCADKIRLATANGIIAAKLMVRVNIPGLGDDAQ
eukprot:4419757-Heterocapsa_arctica.AAC.1